MTAIIPPATIIETIDITTFCQKLKFPVKKARNSKIKASQQTPTMTVPASLEPKEFIAEYFAKRFYITFAEQIVNLYYCAFRYLNVVELLSLGGSKQITKPRSISK
jgi:hypothetical protein